MTKHKTSALKVIEVNRNVEDRVSEARPVLLIAITVLLIVVPRFCVDFITRSTSDDSRSS